MSIDERVPAMSSLATWSALCKDCRNIELTESLSGKRKKKKTGLRQEKFEYSEAHASRQRERGESRSDRCPECRKKHKREIAAFPVAYVDIEAIGEAARYVVDPGVGPTGPLGGLGPLPPSHGRRTESVDLGSFALGLTDQDMITLLEKMSANQVVVLEAGTGTGKSTLAPFRLMNPPDGAPYRPTDIGKIVVTEPRVPATTEVAKFVGEAMCFGHDPQTCTSHIGPGYPVGYQCEGKKVWDEACSLVYVTDGTMVNWILNGELARIGTVIVDEAHERSENIDLILTLLAAQLPRFPHLRVVIASATIDKTYFTKFFEQTPSVRVGHHYVEAAKSIGYGVPLFSDIEFNEEVLEAGFAAIDPKNPDLGPRFKLPGWPNSPNLEEQGSSLRALTKDKLVDLRSPATDWPKNVDQAAVNQTMKVLEATTEGDVLIFLPSQRMVDTARNMLRSRLEEVDWGDNIDVYWLMRATDKDEKERALAECPPGRRKVVVASNLAETSLTIAGIRYVVDSGLVIQAKWDGNLAVAYHPLVPHSQSGVRQRWGRVGRKTHGWVFPLYTLAQYLEMPRDTPAGSTQTNLEGTVLKVLAAGEDPATLTFPADFVADEVVRDSFALESAASFTRERDRALVALQSNGAVSSDGRRLTSLGSELVRSRLPPEQAIALMFADRLACVPEVATALIALGGGEEEKRDKGRLAGPLKIFAADSDWPIEWNVQARRSHEALAMGCVDDLDLVIRVFSLWSGSTDPSRWCSQWWINEGALRAISGDASKLIESLAPGMSKEASRSLDPRLTIRARAVFSRSLSSLRFTRVSSDSWTSINPAQADPVGVSPQHLVAPPDDFIALVRERPRDRGLGSARGEALGLIAVLDWALEGDPGDFELMRRVRVRAQADGELNNDPARTARTSYPIGALIRVSPGDEALPVVEKLSDGLARPNVVRDYSALSDAAGDNALVYSTESQDDSELTSLPMDDLDLPEDLPEVDLEVQRYAESTGQGIAGLELPEEEVRLTPIPIRDLEHPDLEDFVGEIVLVGPDRTPDEEGDVEPGVALTTSDLAVDDSKSWVGSVVAYENSGGFQIVVEPTTQDSPPNIQFGEPLFLKAGELIRTHFASVRVFRPCDSDGRVEIHNPLFHSTSIIDGNVGPDAEAIEEGSIWSGRVIAGQGKHEYSRLSLVDGAIERLRRSDRGKTAESLGSCLAVLTGERFVDWLQREQWVARLELDGQDYRPRLCLQAAVLEKAGLTPAKDIRMKLELRYNVFGRKSGWWDEADVETLVERHPDSFKRDKKSTRFQLVRAEPLSDRDLTTLLELDPGNETYERNSWLVWESSRQVGVRKAEAIGEASVSEEAAKLLREPVNLTSVRKKFSVGVDVSSAGKVLISGVPESVAAALAELEAEASRSRQVVSLPTRPDGRYPRFPPKKDVMSVAGLNAPLATQLRNYDSKTGTISLATSVEAEVDHVLEALGKEFSYRAVHITFADERGFFAFQKKDRWLSLSADFVDLGRWIVADKTTWGVFAKDEKTCFDFIERTRGSLPGVSFEVGVATLLAPTVSALAPPASNFAVAYMTPPKSPDVEDTLRSDISGHEVSSDEPGLQEELVRYEEPVLVAEARVVDLRDGCTILRRSENRIEIRDSVGRSVEISAEDYKRDSRPLHWLREQGLEQ